MSRVLAELFDWGAPNPGWGEDALGEFLRGSGQSDVAPEVLLRIL
jgi:hypothetical protein